MFITFEGQEGAGKSTQIKLLHDYLLGKGANVILVREPGSTKIAEKVRDILKDTANTEMTKKTEALLYLAARAQLVREVISPQLAAGGIVLCDRFTDSTIAYQGFGNGLDIDELTALNDFATGGLVPDITIYLRIDVREGLARKSADSALDRIEQRELSYHNMVKKGYEHLLKNNPQRIFAIDGNLPQEQIIETIAKHIETKTIF